MRPLAGRLLGGFTSHTLDLGMGHNWLLADLDRPDLPQLDGGALFKRLFGAQCPQLSPRELDRFAATFAQNRDAKRTTLRQFRQLVQPGFFSEFAAMRERILARVACRVLWGDRDKFIPVRFAHAFGSRQVTILPDAGHWVALTAPEALAMEIEALAGS
jgi:pimeloyl-ACP methyl ester carboxylesterase